MIGSGLGAGMYATFFQPTYVAPSQPTLPASFSSYTSPAPVANPSPPVPSKTTIPSGLPDFVQAASAARPAVVHIKSKYEINRTRRESDFFSNPFREFFEDEGMNVPHGMASGSGVLISPDGYIATNNHVIEDADEVEVTLFDNQTFPARVVGTDITTDLALLKIDGKALPHLSFGNS
ncbi:MAG: trypsin-like peptidase domain-containing protein, partial [Bacteroidota bacterium]